MVLFVFMTAATLTGCLDHTDGMSLFEADGSDEVTYRYQTPDGRWAFTGSLDLIPAGQRASAEVMDLSEVSLNTELGNAIAESVAQEHERLAAGDECSTANREADEGLVDRMLTHHRPTLGIAAVALLLLFAMPMAARRFGIPLAGRMLTFILPILGLLGTLTFGLTEAQAGLSRARETSSLCDAESFAAAPARDRVERLERLDALLAREGAISVTR